MNSSCDTGGIVRVPAPQSSNSPIGARPVRNPFAASTYLRRNLSQSGPLTFVIVIAVVLVYGIVALVNSIPLSIRDVYGYMRFSLGISPRGDTELLPQLRRIIEAEAPVEPERMIVCRVSVAQVRSIVGKWPFAVLGMSRDDMRYYLRRLGAMSWDGRLPEAGKPEALVSEPVARNLGLTIGSELIGPTIEGSFSPMPVRVVGIARTPQWIMLTSIEYHRLHHLPPVDNLLAMAPDLEQQSRLDRWALERFHGERVQVFAFDDLRARTDESFEILYWILDAVILALAALITLIMAMLIKIHLTQRMPEFGLLEALGYSRGALLRRLLSEHLAVILFGWLAGIACGFGLLKLVHQLVMYPRAFSIDPFDWEALVATVPIPTAVLTAAVLTVWLRLRKLDAIAIIERRLL